MQGKDKTKGRKRGVSKIRVASLKLECSLKSGTNIDVRANFGMRNRNLAILNIKLYNAVSTNPSFIIVHVSDISGARAGKTQERKKKEGKKTIPPAAAALACSTANKENLRRDISKAKHVCCRYPAGEGCCFLLLAEGTVYLGVFPVISCLFSSYRCIQSNSLQPSAVSLSINNASAVFVGDKNLPIHRPPIPFPSAAHQHRRHRHRRRRH